RHRLLTLTARDSRHTAPTYPDSALLNHPTTTEIYPLSLHDALPISDALSARRDGSLSRPALGRAAPAREPDAGAGARARAAPPRDRKSTRLNSSHVAISYAVFCLKKKTQRGGTSRLQAFNLKPQRGG